MEAIAFGTPPGRQLSPLDVNASPEHDSKASHEAKVDEEEDKPDLHVEVRLLESSRIRSDAVSRVLQQYIHKNYASLTVNTILEEDWAEIKLLADNVHEVRVAECADASYLDGSFVSLDQVALLVHVYRATDVPLEEFSAASSQVSQEEAAADGDDVMAASVCDLPAKSLEGLWESLIYEDNIKRRLLNYIAATMEFSEREVSSNIISWHRLVLLHGPPGTGKTSLCRALAQKLAIRFTDCYTAGKLVEINAHSLFSKWFSESGKLVQRLFSRVVELCDDENNFVTVLIDEVESLTAARAGAMSGKEPSDALRVVNALLTQLDKLKMRKNVLVLTTSNLSAAIDPAFIDRADIKLLIPNPPVQAAYAILISCLYELCRGGLVHHCRLLDWPNVEMARATGMIPETEEAQTSLQLRSLAEQCVGMSGRTLRRLPVLAHAGFIMLLGTRRRKEVSEWIKAISAVVQTEKIARDQVELLL